MQVRVSDNFTRNLDEIECFLREANAEAAFEDLLSDLFDRVIPTLERHPDIGRDFLRHQATMEDSAALLMQLQNRLETGETVRELIRGDYILLYSRRQKEIFLLAIKHHRQLSFDFLERWNG
jgi:plasmid stabilization system protein ParE